MRNDLLKLPTVTPASLERILRLEKGTCSTELKDLIQRKISLQDEIETVRETLNRLEEELAQICLREALKMSRLFSKSI